MVPQEGSTKGMCMELRELCQPVGHALSRWLLHLRAALDPSDLTAAPFPSTLSSSSLAASGSDKVTASETWKPCPE